MNKWIRYTTLALCFSCLTPALYAYNHGYPDGRYYAGVNVGYSDFSVPSGATSKNTLPLNLGLVFGNAWELSNFSSYLGYELQGNFYGHSRFKVDGQSISTNIYQVNLLFTGYQFLTPDWNIHAKVGAGYQIDTVSGAEHSTVSGVAPVLSIGAGYNFSPSQAVTLDFTHSFGNSGNALTSKTKISQVNVLSLGWRYYF